MIGFYWNWISSICCHLIWTEESGWLSSWGHKESDTTEQLTLTHWIWEKYSVFVEIKTVWLVTKQTGYSITIICTDIKLRDVVSVYIRKESVTCSSESPWTYVILAMCTLVRLITLQQSTAICWCLWRRTGQAMQNPGSVWFPQAS